MVFYLFNHHPNPRLVSKRLTQSNVFSLLDKPYFSSSPQSTEVFEGSKIILSCGVVSNPPSKILWKKYEDEVALDDERVFQTFQGTLVIIDSTLSDEGVYSCVAENELGSISKEAQVIVKQGTRNYRTTL